MKTQGMFLFVSFLFGAALPVFAGVDAHLPSLKESEAFKQYQMRPKSEMSKLAFLMARFRNSDILVVYDGAEFDSAIALDTARKYIVKHYRGEEAERWVRVHSYRSKAAGEIIQLKFPDGTRVPMRDILVEELMKLKAADPS